MKEREGERDMEDKEMVGECWRDTEGESEWEKMQIERAKVEEGQMHERRKKEKERVDKAEREKGGVVREKRKDGRVRERASERTGRGRQGQCDSH